MTSGRGATRSALVVLAATVLALGPLPVAAAPPTPKTYDGPAYSPALGAPTRPENQSKLWFHAGAWWALLLDPTGHVVRVHELMPDHTWRPTSAVVTSDAGDVGDAVPDGDAVHVVSRHGDGSLFYVRLTFDAGTRDYRAGPPSLVFDRGGSAAATIARDSTGRLWIGYATAIRTVVTYSDDGQTWSTNIPLSVRAQDGPTEMAALVAYDDRIGILWSDQLTGSFQFASHRDGDDPTAWAREQAVGSAGLSDDHINLKRIDGESGDTLVAAIKTSLDDAGAGDDAPLIEVLIRRPDGRWTAAPAGTIADGLTDAVLQVDQETRTVHLFASQHGNIVTKQASFDDLQFTGTPELFAVSGSGGNSNPTGSRNAVDAGTGMVVLSSDETAKAYRHAEAPVGDGAPRVDPSDTTPPARPEDLDGRAVDAGTVALTWAEVVDTGQWVPAEDGARASGYVITRDGVEIATVSEPVFRDEVRDESASRRATVEYTVLAVDASGNRSEAARVVVELPAAGKRPLSPGLVASIAAVGALAAGGGAYLLRRRRLALAE